MLKRRLSNDENEERVIKKLKIENLVDKYDDPDYERKYDFLPKFLPRPAFRMLINGVSGNGKTNLILNFVTKFYIDKQKDTIFKRGIHIFSPSIFTDKAYSSLAKMKEDWIMNDEQKLFMYEDIDLDIIAELVNDKEATEDALIIIDDTAANQILNSRKFLLLFLRSRHKYNSWMITTQAYRLLNKTLRNNCNAQIFYNVITDHELKLIEHELETNKTKIKDIKNAFAKLTDHEFLYHNGKHNKWYVGLSEEEIISVK